MLLQLAEKSTDQFDNRRTEHLFQLECNNIYLYIYIQCVKVELNIESPNSKLLKSKQLIHFATQIEL